MKKLMVGDFAKTIGGKAVTVGSFVEILMEVQEGIFLCGATNGNFIIVEQNLMPLED